MAVLIFDNQQINATFDHMSPTTGGYILNGTVVSLHAPQTTLSYYTHGWQSWSLAAWTELHTLPAPQPAILRPMQVDPVYAQHPSPNGSWLGAVDFADGNILLLGALEFDSHVQLRNGLLQGWYDAVENAENPNHKWFTGYGPELEVFNAYAQSLRERLRSTDEKIAPRVWSSWYSLFTSIDEAILETVITEIKELPFDVLQVDDGWQVSIGDWQANSKFPSGMDKLAEKINATGRKAGLWLAPLLVVPSSKIYQEHPEWLLRDGQGALVSAGFNWGEQLYALDTTHPEALKWLVDLMKQVRSWGYDYIKLDFLYAGALPGKRYSDMLREAAYRHGLNTIRDALGKQAYFLACGAPIIPSLGLCDALRIGPDVAGEWETYRDAVLLYNPATPGARNAIRTTVNRLWLAPLVHTDPDVVYFRTKENRLLPTQKAMLQDLACVCGYKATSDLPQLLSDEEKISLNGFLTCQPTVERTGRYTFQLNERKVDFIQAMHMPERPNGLEALFAAFIGWLGNQPFVLKLLYTLEKNTLEKRNTDPGNLENLPLQ